MSNNNALIRIPTLAALVAAGTLAVAAPMSFADDHADHDRDSSQPVTDTWITTKVKSTLLADSDVAGTEINVDTVDGVVTLAGVLTSQAAVERAIELTRGIDGVVAVDTRALTVR